MSVHADDAGLITIGRGLVDRVEMSVELLASAEHGVGQGRRLVGIARSLVPSGVAIFAQVAPGNAASLRAFLSSGFVPIGAEILVQSASEVTR